jgi:ribonuclease R
VSIEVKEAGLPAESAILEQAILRSLEAAGRRGLATERVGEEVAAAPDERAAALAALQRRGLAVEWEGRWIALAASDWTVAVVERVESGEAVLRRRGEREPAFVAVGRRRRGALDGDLVLVEAAPESRRRGRGDLEEVVVLRVLRRGFERLVGTLEIDEVDRRWLVPFDPKVTLEVEVLEAEKLLEGPYVVVEVERGGEPTRHPRGRVVEVLGVPSSPGVDTAVVLRHYGIPDPFPPAPLAAAAALPADPGEGSWRGREDLRGATVVTIDGETARDLDDAVSVTRLPAGGFRLGVHIADVSAYVAAGSELDLEAYRRGTSVYFPERAVPMLPERLSSGLCSLQPGVPRLTLSVFLDLDGEGRVRSRRFAETVIESRRRLTYEEVRRVLEEPAPGDAERYGPVLPALGAMRQVTALLRERRRERGSLDFDLPAGDVVLDTDGYTVGIRPEQRHVAHRLIEELMIAANEAVAQELSRRGMPALYRVHEAPPAEALSELRGALATFGLRLPRGPGQVEPRDLQQVMEAVAGRPEEGFVGSLLLRSLPRAVYLPQCRGHYALAAAFYTHFTSPIRRYPDLMVHRALKALIGGGGDVDPTLAERLETIAEHSSSCERRAEQAERDLLQWKKVRFLAGRVGERFRGRITGVQPFGLFVQLEDLYVDGLLPIRTLEDDYYLYEAEAHRLVGDKRGRVFRLADEIEVILAGVSERHRGLDLKPAVLWEPPRRSAGQNKRRRRHHR